MTYAELQAAVADKIQDTSAAYIASIPTRINEAYALICENANLPSLKAIGVVSASLLVNYVNIKTTLTSFSGKLRYVGTSEGRIPILDGGLDALIDEYPDFTVTGEIEKCAIEGDILWYMNIPTAATSLTLMYYKVPDDMVEDSDTPIELPSYLHRGLIVNKTAELIFSDIEDGIDGPKINTLMCERDFTAFNNQLLAWVSKRRGCVGGSVWDV